MSETPCVRPRETAFDELMAYVRTHIPAAELVRIVPLSWPRLWNAMIHFYDLDYARIHPSREVHLAVLRRVRRLFPGYGVELGFDLHVPTHAVYRAPGPLEVGFVPEDDGTFGLAASRVLEAPRRRCS